MFRANTPKSCLTCRHRRTTEYGPALAAGIRVNICHEFVSWEPMNPHSEKMSCFEAFTTLCQGDDWSPTARFIVEFHARRLWDEFVAFLRSVGHD